jgi:NitT/TauT family transport system substrate-binding protein
MSIGPDSAATIATVMQKHAPSVSRRAAIAGAASAFAAAGTRISPAGAATKVRFLTNWFAEAEHGGFYQAKATGLYDKAGLDVDIQMGGPQVNGMQLLGGGAADIIVSYDIQVLDSISKGVPAVAIGAINQFDLQGIMTHPDVVTLASLKGRKILVASTAFSTFWPWLKLKYGFTDEQAGTYTFNLQPFYVDPTLAQQGYVTAEPFEAQKHGAKTKFFLFADAGYPPYSTTLVTTRPYMEKNAETVAKFIRATMQGWKTYLTDPGPGNALIKAANPKMEDDQIAYSIGRFKAIKCVTGGDAATHGIGIMTEDRWKKTRDFMVGAHMLAADVPWKSAFTTEFVQGLKIIA